MTKLIRSNETLVGLKDDGVHNLLAKLKDESATSSNGKS
jgi:hypothetical protein